MLSESIRRGGSSWARCRTRVTGIRRRSSRTACGCITRFPLSFREVEELKLVRGVIVTYETIRQWCAKFRPVYAAGLRRRQPRPGDKWHLDEVFLTINGPSAVSVAGRRPGRQRPRRHCQLEQSEGDFRRFASAIHQVACDV